MARSCRPRDGADRADAGSDPRACRPGYLLQLGGTVEDSARGQNSINAGMPLFVLVVTTLLMLQLRSFSRVLLVWLTAPLGLIGVTCSCWCSGCRSASWRCSAPSRCSA
jgi:multidrug efflux pump subunit AcrB